MPRLRIGDILREKGLSEARLTEALQRQAGIPGARLGMLLLRAGAVTEEDLAMALARQAGLPYEDLRTSQVDPQWAFKLGRSQAQRLQVLPLRMEGGVIQVAMARPEVYADTQDLSFLLGHRVQLVVVSPSQLNAAIQRHLGLETTARKMLQGQDPLVRHFVAAPTSIELDAVAVERFLAKGGQVYTELVNLLLVHAVERRASDIHVEPQPDSLRVRFRIDGVLREVLSLASEFHGALLGRIKVLGQMDVAERRKPQDGKVSVSLAGRSYDLRLAILPTQFGEKVVMRILDAGILERDFSSLGWPAEPLRRCDLSANLCCIPAREIQTFSFR